MTEDASGLSVAYSDMEVREDELIAISSMMDAACRDMWSGVLNRTIKDATGKVTIDPDELEDFHDCPLDEFMALDSSSRILLREAYKKHCIEDALSWLDSDEDEVGSFLWICTVLGLDDHLVRGRVKAKIASKKKPLFKSDEWV